MLPDEGKLVGGGSRAGAKPDGRVWPPDHLWKLFDQRELLDAVPNALGVHQGPIGGRDRVDESQDCEVRQRLQGLSPRKVAGGFEARC